MDKSIGYFKRLKNMPFEDKLLLGTEFTCYILSYTLLVIFVLIIDRALFEVNILLIIMALILLYQGLDARKSRNNRVEE